MLPVGALRRLRSPSLLASGPQADTAPSSDAGRGPNGAPAFWNRGFQVVLTRYKWTTRRRSRSGAAALRSRKPENGSASASSSVRRRSNGAAAMANVQSEPEEVVPRSMGQKSEPQVPQGVESVASRRRRQSQIQSATQDGADQSAPQDGAERKRESEPERCSADQWFSRRRHVVGVASPNAVVQVVGDRGSPPQECARHAGVGDRQRLRTKDGGVGGSGRGRSVRTAPLTRTGVGDRGRGIHRLSPGYKTSWSGR